MLTASLNRGSDSRVEVRIAPVPRVFPKNCNSREHVIRIERLRR